MTKTLSVALAALALVAGGCGGGDDKISHKPSGSDKTTTNRADQAIAEAAVFQLSDFPSGWEAQPADDDDAESQEEHSRKVADCMGISLDEYLGAKTGDAESKTFANDDDNEISNDVNVFATEAEASSNFAIRDTEKFRECFEDKIQEYLEDTAKDQDDVTIGDATLNELSFDKLGDDTIALRLTIPVESGDVDVDVIIDYVGVRVGRSIASFQTQGTLSAFGTDQLVELANISLDRLTAELGGEPTRTETSAA